MQKHHYTGYEFFLATDLCFIFPLFCHFFLILIFIFEHSRGHKWLYQWKITSIRQFSLRIFLFPIVTSHALKLKQFCGIIIYVKQHAILAMSQTRFSSVFFLRRANGCTQSAAQR